MHRRHGRLGRIAAVRGSIKKFVEITREMTRIRDKRRAMAMAAEARTPGDRAAELFHRRRLLHHGAGTIEDGDAVNLALSARRTPATRSSSSRPDTGSRRSRSRSRPRRCPATCIFPRTRRNERLVEAGGMDNFKEMLVTSPSDKSSSADGVPRSMDPARTKRAFHVISTVRRELHRRRQVGDGFLRARSERPRPHRLTGISMGSFWLTQMWRTTIATRRRLGSTSATSPASTPC